MKKSKGKKALDITLTVLTGLIFLFVAYELVIKFTGNSVYLFGYRVDCVESGSMSYVNSDPEVKSFLEGHTDQFAKGDLIYSVKINADTPVEVYDTVMFVNPKNNLVTTHRVVAISGTGENAQYQIRADTANHESYDGWFSKDKLIAKKVGSTPWLGNIVRFLRSIYGMIMLIGLAVILILYTYFSNQDKNKKKALENANSQELEQPINQSEAVENSRVENQVKKENK